MKALVVSDEESPFIWDYFDRAAFEGVEIVLSCGDLQRDYLEFICTMLPVPLYYVPGNHDKKFAEHPPEGCLPLDGGTAVCRGLRMCGLGGCRSDAPGRLYECSDAHMTKRANKLKKSIEKMGGLDVLVTHAPPEGLGDGPDRFHRGFSVFRALMEEYRPRVHLFGHVHRRCGADRPPAQYGATRLVNACGYKIVEI